MDDTLCTALGGANTQCNMDLSYHMPMLMKMATSMNMTMNHCDCALGTKWNNDTKTCENGKLVNMISQFSHYDILHICNIIF